MGNVSLRLLVIGIDGASYAIISRLMGENRLPVMARLARAGAFGKLQSSFPPHTAPAWSSIFTGVNPGEHGIYQFWNLQRNSYHPPITTVADFGWEPLWQTLSRLGLSVGAYNVPMSHPPKPIKSGYIITWPLSPTINYSYPREIVHTLARKGLHHQSDLVTMYRKEADYLSQATEFIHKRTDTLLYLMDQHPVDVMIAVYTELDRISHYYWSHADDAGSEVAAIYQAMDVALGRLIEKLPDNLPIMIVSDHGFGHCSCNLHINEVLREAELLAVKPASTKKDSRYSAPRFFEDSAIVAGNSEWFNSSEMGIEVNWGRTFAYMPAPGCYGININAKGRQHEGIVDWPNDRRIVEKQLEYFLAKLTAIFGEPVFELVPRSEVYRGHRVEDAPDYLLLPKRWDVMPHPGMGQPVIGMPTQKGIHREDGVIIAANFKGLKDLSAARVEDVTPTALACLGLPISEGIEGTILGSNDYRLREPTLRQSRRSPTELNMNYQIAMENRLRGLGYL